VVPTSNSRRIVQMEVANDPPFITNVPCGAPRLRVAVEKSKLRPQERVQPHNCCPEYLRAWLIVPCAFNCLVGHSHEKKSIRHVLL
jgi:hypothetical protein